MIFSNTRIDYNSSPEQMSENKIRLFISHSSNDSLFVQSLIDLIRAALNLGSSQIRCTSIDGYRLPGGANTSEQLKQEVHNADSFIGIISAASINSVYVVFELGARWGANRSLIPLIAPGTDMVVLKGPLQEINALSTNRSQLHQLLHQISEELSVSLEPSASFERHIDSILSIDISTRFENDSISKEVKSASFATSEEENFKSQEIDQKATITKIAKLISNEFVTIPSFINDNEGELSKDLFSVFINIQKELVVGVTNKLGAQKRSLWIYYEVCPKLKVNGLVDLLSIQGVEYQKFSLSKTGEAVIKAYDEQRLKRKSS